MRRIRFVLMVLLMSGCVTTGEPQVSHGVTVTTSVAISNCRPIGKFFGHSSAYGVFAGSGFSEAKEAAMQQAAANGATHITWVEEITRYGSTSVAGIAADCSEREAPKKNKAFERSA